MKQFFTVLIAAALASSSVLAQSQTGGRQATASYSNYAQLTARLQALTRQAGSTASVRSIGKSVGGKDIWLLTIGRGKAAEKPALALVAGVEGSHLAGTELSLQLAERFLTSKNDSISRMLDTKTIYILPLINPDAQEQAFSALKYERSGNGSSTDDDRDGQQNEDPVEDLNRDGLITQVRIEDPTGTFVASKTDPRVLLKADPAKGESGKYVLISEGTDTDKDGAFNEDGAGGVALDKNFTFDYPFFTPGAGEMPVSEPENRALLDFLAQTPSVYAVFTFGPYNNLSEAPKFDRMKTTKRIITGLLERDAATGEQVSKLYNAQTGLKDAPAMPATKGNFAQTAYYHHGRFSFSTPGWWVPKDEPKTSAKKDSAGTAAAPRPAGRPAPAAGGDSDDARFLKWADANGVTDAFVTWTPIEHPDFPGKKAEVGGIVPFAKLNPPTKFLTDHADRHAKFITAFAAQMPSIDIVNLKAESLGNNLTRVSAQVINQGLMPTGSDMGNRVRFVPRMKIELKTTDKQSIVSGRRIMLRGAMAAGETMDVTFLVSGSGRVTLEAGNDMTGVKSVDVTLK
ncbi:M14 family metallopeptidase [Spirosoma sp. KUDC1026]|uniref:M14 family metallopeptidase n=1 Tax=Spirosoma sp. KUDC1026 TaxID=2745947 RepID=UPI00159BBD0E|nr:M14 family metallopeptidase [Spirosoma sp. KUDC1026]QKZ14628.1 peptidase M14 [Spirosoma sp. KUDC1026]